MTIKILLVYDISFPCDAVYDFAFQYNKADYLCLYSNFIQCVILYCLCKNIIIYSLIRLLSFIDDSDMSCNNNSLYSIVFHRQGKKVVL